MKRRQVVKKNGTWRTTSKGRTVPGTKARTKAVAVKKGAAATKKAATKSKPITLQIKKKNGRVQSERTYPRSADPKKSKG